MRNPRKATAEATARNIHRELGITSIEDIDVVRIAALHDAMVRERALSGLDGMMIRRGRSAVISVRKSIPEQGKKRFVVAHELGHIMLHPTIRQADRFQDGEVDRLSYRQSGEEREANYFAAELLMPQDLFVPAMRPVDPSFDEIHRLSACFGTTLSAAAIQFVRYSKEPCAFIITKGLGRPWCFTPEGFDFWIEDRDKVHGHSVTAHAFSRRACLERAQDVPAGIWFRGYSDTGKDYITEEALVLGNTGIAYTLLWVHDCI